MRIRLRQPDVVALDQLLQFVVLRRQKKAHVRV
jgi:hypothetical protein